MRRYFLLCLCLLSMAFGARAEKVTPQQAAAVAERFLQAESPATKASQVALRLTGTWPQAQTKGAAEEPALYIFEREGGGYVVVAGDDVSLPVIGYSTTGRLQFDQLPSNLLHILDWHASMIAYARKQGLQADADTKAQWLKAGNAGEAVQLETAQWDQRAPYNSLIPKLNGQACPTGCVATAMAIILRYHQWPEKGTGSLPGYYWSDGDRQIEGYALDHTYDWSQMPLKYESGKYTTEQGAQVAQLMYDLAVMSSMQFHPSGSSAAGSVSLKLARYFGYDKQLRYVDWDYFKMDVWEEMLREEIDAGRPVFYVGTTDNEGHAFVVDGYKGAYFSLNYGWSGSQNGYYLLKPSVPLDKDAATKFCSWQGMVTHIYPDRGGELYISIADDVLLPFPWDFRSKSFPVGDHRLYQFASDTGSLWLVYALYDREGRFKALTTDSVLVHTDNPYMPGLTCNITCSIEEGDCLYLSKCEDGQWKPILQSHNAYLEFHPGKKISELVSVGYSIGDPEDYGLDAAPCFSLRGNTKEIYWEVWSEDLGVLLSTSKSLGDDVTYGDGRYVKTEHWVRETDEFRFVFHYPAGTYRILLRNFDEELTLYVKL